LERVKTYLIDTQAEVFQHFLDLLKVKIFTDQGKIIIRDLRDPVFAMPLEYWGKSTLPWYCAFARCSDYVNAEYLGCKAEIILGMYYTPFNSDSGFDHIPVGEPVMACDFALFGGYHKTVLLDGKVIHHYAPAKNNPAFSIWVSLKTGYIFPHDYFGNYPVED
jgi:hypothetical protein